MGQISWASQATDRGFNSPPQLRTELAGAHPSCRCALRNIINYTVTAYEDSERLWGFSSATWFLECDLVQEPGKRTQEAMRFRASPIPSTNSVSACRQRTGREINIPKYHLSVPCVLKSLSQPSEVE
jgi:hypothetical protein